MSLIGPLSNGNGRDSGGVRGEGTPTCKDVRLIEKALSQGWDVPDDMKTLALTVLADVLRDPNTRPREKVQAARATIHATKTTLDAIRTAAFATKNLPDTKHEGAREVGRLLREIRDETLRLAAMEEARMNGETQDDFE